MNRNIFRLLLLVPVSCLILSALEVFGNHENWPIEALTYDEWFINQPLADTAYILNRIGIAALLLMLISTIGLLLFWSPSRYIYVLSIFVALLAESPIFGNMDLPILIGKYQPILESVTGIASGMIIALLFTNPIKGYFIKENKDT